MALTRVFAIVLRQYYLMRGSFARLVPMFVWVMIDIVLWGFITRYLNSVSDGHFNFTIVMLGAILIWDFFTRVMQGVVMAFLEDVWSRNFLNIFAAPLRVVEYIGGLVITSICTSLIGLVVMLALAFVMFDLSPAAYGPILAVYLFELFLFGIALGIAAAGMALRLGPAAEWFVWPIPALVSPFACVFYPLATLPPWMQIVAKGLPPAYIFEGMRASLNGQVTSLGDLGIGAALGVFYVGLSIWFFTRVYRYAVRTGLLARYSAESVS